MRNRNHQNTRQTFRRMQPGFECTWNIIASCQLDAGVTQVYHLNSWKSDIYIYIIFNRPNRNFGTNLCRVALCLISRGLSNQRCKKAPCTSDSTGTHSVCLKTDQFNCSNFSFFDGFSFHPRLSKRDLLKEQKIRTDSKTLKFPTWFQSTEQGTVACFFLSDFRRLEADPNRT